MEQNHLQSTLTRLRAAADACLNGFPVSQWSRVSGPGPELLELHGDGAFRGLALEPGATVLLRCDGNLPEEALGVRLAGDALEATLFSLYPVTLRHNGVSIFTEEGVPVAAGPALIELISELKAGENGSIEFEIRPPLNQTMNWVHLHLTTPGLRARFELLDIAWSQLALAEAFAVTEEERKLVESAASIVPETLVTSDTAGLQHTFEKMAQQLEPLSARIAEITVHLIGHSHIDMNWLWTWPDTVEVIRRDFKSVLNLMNEFPELTFSHSQPATYEVFRREEPELFQKVLKHIQAERWECTTLAWIEGDVNMASGEAHARQLLEGVHYTRETLGTNPVVYHAPDTFGHAGNLPQLAASAGAIAYYHHRANAGQENQWPAYWWEGQDYTRLMGLSTFSYNGEIFASNLAKAAIHAHKFGQTAALHFHGIGDHGGGPSRQNLQCLRRLQQTPLLPTARCSRLDRYVKEIQDSGVALLVKHGESSAIFEGCYTTHADTKFYNRQGENLLCTADTLAALAGIDCSAELLEPWRAVLFNQFHDILDGSAIHEAYIKNREDFEAVSAVAASVTERALDQLQNSISSGQIAVTNPLGHDREDSVLVSELQGTGAVWLVDSQGNRIPGQYSEEGLVFIAQVPAFATVAYRLETDSEQSAGTAAKYPVLVATSAYAPTDSRVTQFLQEVAADSPYLRIETLLYCAYVRKDNGIIVSFVDKRVGRELVAYGLRRGSDYVDTARPDLGLNVFTLQDEKPHGLSAWQLQEVHAESYLIQGAEVKQVSSGPVFCELEVTHTIRESKLVQRIRFWQQLARVDFDVRLEWNELGSPEKGIPNLKSAFTASLPECRAWFETPFAAAQRPANGQETSALRWADIGGAEYGFALINNSKYGYDALGCRLRISLVRSGYDPDLISDPGKHHIRYRFYPHPGSWQDAGVVDQAADFNQPLLARVRSEVKSQSAATAIRPIASDGSVKIAGLKRARNGSGVIIRLYESTGRNARMELKSLGENAQVTETSIVEDPIRSLPALQGKLSLAFRPWQVRTLRIEQG